MSTRRTSAVIAQPLWVIGLGVAQVMALAVTLGGCDGGGSDSAPPPPPLPSTTVIVPGVNPAFDDISDLASSAAPSGPWQSIDASRYDYDPADESLALIDAVGATGAECAAWLRLQGSARVDGQSDAYTLYTYVPACGVAAAANELTSLAVGLVADGDAESFDAAVMGVANMTGVAAEAITAPVPTAERDAALRAAMMAAAPGFRDGGFVPGEDSAQSFSADIDNCITVGALAFNDWTRPEAGGSGPPAGESDGDYYRCKACHGWDRLGSDGGYARRSREQGRANAGYLDPNNCAAVPTAGCTPTRNISTDPVFGALTNISSGWEILGGRTWSDGRAAFDGTDPWGAGTILGNRHPDLSAAGANASDLRPTAEQLHCLNAYLNHPDSWLSSAFSAIDVSLDPIVYTPAGGDAARGEVFYNEHTRGACFNCHGTPDDPDGGPFTAGPAGGLKAWVTGDGKPSELMHKVLWGEPGSFMTRASMHAPTPIDVADLVAYLTAFSAPLSATDDSATTTRAVAVTIDVLANDRGDGRTITDYDATSASGGMISCADPHCDYEPFADFTGEDSFSYTISDGSDSATATVTITVLPPPVSASDDLSTTMANVPVTIDVLANDNGDNLSITAFDTLSDAGGIVDCTAATCSYSPAADFVGIDAFSYTASDGVSEDVAEVLITVTEPAPVTVAVDDTALTESGVAVVIDVLANDQGDGLSIVAFDATSNSGGTVNCSAADCTYTPPAGFTGDDTFTYTVSNGVDNASATVQVTVAAGPPVVAADDTAFTVVEAAVVIDVLGNDSGNNLAIVSFDTTGVNGGSVACSASDCTYTPPPALAGNDSFTYTMSDGLTSDTATVSVVIESTAPIVVANDDAAETPSGTAVSVNVLGNDVGVGLAIVGFDTVSAAGGSVDCTGAACQYTPPTAFSGADSFGYTAGDAFTSDVATVSVSVSVVALDDQAVTQSDVALTIAVLDNDLGSALTITAADATSTAGGIVACTSSQCSYTPPVGFAGADSFAYTAGDGLTEATALVNIEVRTAVVAVDDSATTPADVAVTVNVLANDSGDSIVISDFDAVSVAGGTVTCVATDCLYTPPTGFTGDDSFGYAISDGQFSDTATVTVTVEEIVPVGDFETGRMLYDADCASCHSAGTYDPSGFAGDVAGTGLLLVPDLGDLDASMSGLLLSDQDILDFIAFLDDPSIVGQ